MIRKSIKKGLSALLVTVSILSLVGCGGQKTLDEHYTVDTPTYNFPKTLNFESDGDCDYNDTLGITYKIEDGRLRFYLGAISEVYDFTKNGNKITLTKDGQSVTYSKD